MKEVANITMSAAAEYIEERLWSLAMASHAFITLLLFGAITVLMFSNSKDLYQLDEVLKSIEARVAISAEYNRGTSGREGGRTKTDAGVPGLTTTTARRAGRAEVADAAASADGPSGFVPRATQFFGLTKKKGGAADWRDTASIVASEPLE